MTTDPHYAREQLAELAKSLESRRTGRRWGAKAATRLEVELVQGMYLIGKLQAANELSETAANHRYEINMFPKRVRQDDGVAGAEMMHDLYQMNHANTEHLTSLQISTHVVHNALFELCLTPGRMLTGVFLSSVDTRDEKLLLIGIDQIIQIFRQASQKA